MDWEDFRWFRSLWKGPLIIKGIMTPEDARMAVDQGADGIVVSNHGGRQLDYMDASIDALPEIADAVVYLASDRASAITGQALDVNGGNWFH